MIARPAAESLMSTPPPVPAYEPSPAMPTAARPALPPPPFLHARLPLLDILRGFALPGILLMNIEWFTRPMVEIGFGIPPSYSPVDHATSWLIFVLVQGKFWLLFSLLFGAGFTVMRQRLIASGRPFVWPYLRRCAALFVLGIAHALLLWAGDILHTYAVAGVGLLIVSMLTDSDPRRAAGCRGAAGATIFLMFTGLLTLFTVLYLVAPNLGLHEPGEIEAARATFDAAQAQAVAAYSAGSWPEVTAQRGVDLLDAMKTDLFVVPVALGVFLIGSWLLDSGRLSRPQEHLRFHKAVAFVALPIGLLITAAGSWHSTGSVDGQSSAATMISQWTHWSGAPLMTFGYIGIVTLLALQPSIGGVLRRWLAPSGQMALTNYLMASAICSTLFFGYGFGLWGQVSRLGQVGLVAAILVLQCAVSAWWLRRFRYGPLEWLWRAATWLELPPMRRSAA
jgi:uncharacterized protein